MTTLLVLSLEATGGLRLVAKDLGERSLGFVACEEHGLIRRRDRA